jgi:osmotically inducible lipoprotein OsmB
MKELHMKNLVIVFIVILSFSLLGCSGMSDTQQRTLSGSAIGAVAGTAIGAISGHAGWGAAIGAVAGAGGGFLYDKNEKSKDAAYEKGYEDAQRK